MKNRRKHKINGEVRFPQVRVIGEGEPIIMTSKDAFFLASSKELDLILINENANPPVVKIADYNKFVYDQEKIEKERKKKSLEMKEVQVSVNIGENDFATKARKAKEFLSDGHKVKCVLSMKGREKAHPELAEITILKFVSALSEKGSPESLPALEGSRWIVIIKPKK